LLVSPNRAETINLGSLEPFCKTRAEEQMVDTQAGIAGECVPKIFPECVEVK
jgi:hypothetical protein